MKIKEMRLYPLRAVIFQQSSRPRFADPKDTRNPIGLNSVKAKRTHPVSDSSSKRENSTSQVNQETIT